MAKLVKSSTSTVRTRKKGSSEEIPKEAREEVRSWIEEKIMERVQRVKEQFPDVLKTPEGKEWLKLRDILRLEVSDYYGALSKASLSEAMEVLELESYKGKPTLVRNMKP